MRLFGNLTKLDRESWLLLVVSMLYVTATMLSNSFVNVYLWKIKHDLQLLGWFHLIHFTTATFTFIFAGWLSKRVDRVFSIRLGVISLAIFYVLVLYLGQASADYAYLLAIFIGLGAGFFWLAFNVLYFEITERDNRDVFNAVNGFLTSLAGIIGPLFSGYIITQSHNSRGYQIIFAISLVLYLSAVIVSFIFKRRMVYGRFYLMTAVKESIRKKSSWSWVSLAMMAQGVREGVFYFLIGMLVYLTTKNEFILGSFITITSLALMIAYAVAGKIIKPHWRNKSILISTLIMGFAIIPFVFYMNSWSLFFLGIVVSVVFPFYMNPFTATVFDRIGENEERVKLRVEYVVSRELSLNVGRIIGIAAFIWWVKDSAQMEHLRWLLLPLGFSQVLVWFFIRRIPEISPNKKGPRRPGNSY